MAALASAREGWVDMGEGNGPVRLSLSLFSEFPIVRISKISVWPWASSLSP